MQNVVCVPSIRSFSQNRPEWNTTAPGWRPYIYSQIPVSFRCTPANHTVPRRQNGATLSPVPHNPEKKQKETNEKQSNRPWSPYPSILLSASCVGLCNPALTLSHVAAAPGHRLGGGKGVRLLPFGACLGSLSFMSSPGRRVALDSWSTWPQHQRTYVWPQALKHPPRGMVRAHYGLKDW